MNVQVINLEAIESVGINKAAEELKEKIKLVEVSQDRAFQTMQSKLKQAKQVILYLAILPKLPHHPSILLPPHHSTLSHYTQ